MLHYLVAVISSFMVIGYARVSSETQDPNGQVKELEKVCDRVHKEYASGGRWERPELQHILRHIKAGDVLVVWKLDRLTRSLSDMLRIFQRLEDSRAGFRSLTESIDTTTPVGRMLMQLLGSFAEFERAMIRERTKLGLARARAEGKNLGGGHPKLSPKQQHVAIRMIEAEGRSQSEVAEVFNVNRSTICRLMQERRVLGSK
jgi:DNA invertase Pin-like site-specific DNA recombinase